MTIPCVGAVVATALAALVPAASTFRRGRDFAAWLGLTSRQHSTAPAVENPPWRIDTADERLSYSPMKRLTPIEHAKAKGKTITMSMPDRGPEVRAQIRSWLEKRPGDGWFYAQGDNYAFGTPADAAAFKQWLMSEAVA